MIIESFARFILGGILFSRIKRIVSFYSVEDITGEEKKQRAVEEARGIGIDISSWLLNLAIELAVAWAKTKEK